ncbi:CynX/NimT family MFS transporter [Streptomyces sp. NPDC086766]|uniref:CynX/NimT family MFS transporter n=1 Tax=Streptomyces sp. NPDC086766 TaxID=3365754 RepID=UPI00380777A5
MESDIERGLERELDGAVEPVRHARWGPLRGTLLLAVGLVLAALNLRPAVTSASSLLDDIQANLGASASWAGTLTTIPTLCFATVGLAAPWLARKIGLARAVSLALLVLATGLGLRVLGGALALLGASFLACAGIAIANVLVPVVVKESFPLRIGLMTGAYTAALQGGGALAAAVTPLAEVPLGGWRLALLLWAGLALIALVVWVAVARHEPAQVLDSSQQLADASPSRGLSRSTVAWTVTCFMGLQSFTAYVVMGWLPQVYIGAGLSKGEAGLMLSIATVVAVPLSMVIPAAAARARNQAPWIVGLTLAGMLGVLGLIVAPTAAAWLWATLIGASMTVFSLALTVISLRSPNPQTAAKLSAMAQGIGYLIASFGPMLFGLLHDAAGGWRISLTMLLAVMALQMLVGALAGRNRSV